MQQKSEIWIIGIMQERGSVIEVSLVRFHYTNFTTSVHKLTASQFPDTLHLASKKMMLDIHRGQCSSYYPSILACPLRDLLARLSGQLTRTPSFPSFRAWFRCRQPPSPRLSAQQPLHQSHLCCPQSVHIQYSESKVKFNRDIVISDTQYHTSTYYFPVFIYFLAEVIYCLSIIRWSVEESKAAAYENNIRISRITALQSV